MPVRWSQRGKRQLVELIGRISEERPMTAKRLARRIRDMVDRIGQQPLSGQAVPEFGEPSVRERSVSSWRLIYLVQGQDVTILSVFHGRRLLPETLDEL